MKPRDTNATTIVDRVLAQIPPISLTVANDPFIPEGRENLVHYLMGTQEPWIDRPASRADFLLREGLLTVHRVLPDPATDESTWAMLVDAAKSQALKVYDERNKSEASSAVRFLYRVRPAESDAQIKQRVWLAIVLYNLGFRGLHFDDEGAVLADGGVGVPVGIAPDYALEITREQRADRFYTATYAHRLRETGEGDYPVELVRGRGRMRWYVHEVRVDPRTWGLFEVEQEPVERHVALVVAGDEHVTGPALPRDYYRDPAFQQAVIDAEDGEFDLTLVLSPRFQVVALDQTVEDDLTWNDLDRWTSPWMTPMNWAWTAQNRLWRLCLDRRPLPLEPDSLTRAAKPVSWGVWRHPSSHYQFTIFGQSDAVFMLSQFLRGQASVDTQPGYSPPDYWADEPGGAPPIDDFTLDEVLRDLGLEEEMTDDLREAFVGATTQATTLSDILFLPGPPSLHFGPRILASDEMLEPIMLLRTRDCDVDQVIEEVTTLLRLLDEDMLSFNLLIDAPSRLNAVLRIISAVIDGEEENVRALSEQVLPPILHERVQDRSLDLVHDRLDPLLAFAETLSGLAILLNDDDRDRLSIWQRTFWSAEMRYNDPDAE